MKRNPNTFTTNDIIKIIDGLNIEDLRELTRAQHDSNGKRKLKPILDVKKYGKQNVYSFQDLMIVFLYQTNKTIHGSKELFRIVAKLPKTIDKILSENKLNILSPFDPKFCKEGFAGIKQFDLTFYASQLMSFLALNIHTSKITNILMNNDFSKLDKTLNYAIRYLEPICYYKFDLLNANMFITKKLNRCT